MQARRAFLDEVLRGYDFTVTTDICLLEFKATIIQECITIHGKLRHIGRYTVVRDELTESDHRQKSLRIHILNNLVNVYGGSSFAVSEDQDRRLADKARLRLQSIVPKLYDWFRKESVDAVLDQDVKCTRADERPSMTGVKFEANIPECHKGKKQALQDRGVHPVARAGDYSRIGIAGQKGRG